jgi:hypothetical protein
MLQLDLEPIFAILSYVYPILLGQVISGLLVKTGAGYGRIIGENRFAKPHMIFLFGLLDAVVCGVLSYLTNSIFLRFITEYPFSIYGLTMELAFVGYVKTCHTLGRKLKTNFKKYWKGVAFVQVTSILNFALVGLLIYYKII